MKLGLPLELRPCSMPQLQAVLCQKKTGFEKSIVLPSFVTIQATDPPTVAIQEMSPVAWCYVRGLERLDDNCVCFELWLA